MDGTGKNNGAPKQDDGKPTQPPPLPPRESDEDDEDGDFATPKRDRYGPDDEPL